MAAKPSGDRRHDSTLPPIPMRPIPKSSSLETKREAGPSAVAGKGSFWPEGGWKLMEFRIGILPLTVYLVLLAVIIWFTEQGGKFPGEICMMMAVLAVGGFTCGEIGKRLPVLHHFGAAAIFATFIPSYLVYKKILPEPLITSVTDFTKGTNFLYLFIAAVIVGSILVMDRTERINGAVMVLFPTAAATG